MSTDSEIIRRSLAQPSAFGELFERHARAIGGYLETRVGPSVADDLVSETFIVAFRKRHRFDHARDTARPWLFGIATRFVHKHRTAEARRWAALATVAAVEGAVPASDPDDVDARLEAMLRLQDLAPAITALPARERDALLLFALGDLDYRSVAEALNVPIGTVRSRIHRARRRLGDVLDVRPAHDPPVELRAVRPRRTHDLDIETDTDTDTLRREIERGFHRRTA